MWRLLGFAIYFLSAWAWGAELDINFFGDQPIPQAALIHTPEPKPDWLLYGAPIALLCFFFSFVFCIKNSIFSFIVSGCLSSID